MNGPIVEEPALGEEDNTALSCKVCGMRHSISTGKVRQAALHGQQLIMSLTRRVLRRGRGQVRWAWGYRVTHGPGRREEPGVGRG